ncbi:hypothetical protein [Moorena sp. SIO3B2]|uniref:hypothetical protein n=1 Tax=Moorena sp. SIO3B2 TaxID=2607827 RepID=UPI0013C5B53F|nr:hypothetical protein [Moorena sp. SIO3B2]NEP36910.1 hypothetical protein [Moorena sp. SIO3B2]
MIELATATKRENRLLLVISAIWDKSAIRALPDASRSRLFEQRAIVIENSSNLG